MSRPRYDFRWLAIAVLCTVSVLTLTHLPQDPTPEVLRKGFFHIDKAEHFLAYGVISLLFVLSLKRPVAWGLWLAVLFAVVVVSLADELTQPWVGRQCTLTDIAANLAGVASVGLLAQGWRFLRR